MIWISSEDKKPLPAKLDAAGKRKLAAITRTLPDSGGRRHVRSELASIRSKLVDELNGVAKRVQAGALNAKAARTQAAAVMTQPVLHAMRLGFLLAGVPGWQPTNEQLDDVASLIGDEADFFGAFMAELASEAVSHRIGLYGGVVDSGMWRGWTTTMPEGSKIDWVLGMAEHCQDCIDLAANGPYTEETLPTLPRNGDTRCLGNCKCTLRSSNVITSGLDLAIDVEVTSVGGAPVDPTSPGAIASAAPLQGMADTYGYLLRLDEMFPGQGYGAAARETNRRLEDMAARIGLRVRLTLTDAEIVGPILAAMVLGFDPVEPGKVTADMKGRQAIVVTPDRYDRGTILRVGPHGKSIVLGDGGVERTYQTDLSGLTAILVAKDQSKPAKP